MRTASPTTRSGTTDDEVIVLRPTKERQLEIVLEWPVYVTDNDEVTCYQDGCIETNFLGCNFLGWPRRRTWGQLCEALIRHIDEIHGWDI
jgi:hypothetical protein